MELSRMSAVIFNKWGCKMKEKISLALLILLVISALGLYVSAQVQPDNQQGEIQKAVLFQGGQSQNKPGNLQADEQNLANRTMLIDKVVMTLLQSRTPDDGEWFSCTKPGHSANMTGKLRIKMMDGSSQEIPLLNVKEVTIEQQRLPAK